MDQNKPILNHVIRYFIQSTEFIRIFAILQAETKRDQQAEMRAARRTAWGLSPNGIGAARKRRDLKVEFRKWQASPRREMARYRDGLRERCVLRDVQA